VIRVRHPRYAKHNRTFPQGGSASLGSHVFCLWSGAQPPTPPASVRFHRSRVNYVNKAEPIGVSRTVETAAAKAPAVYTPFSDALTAIECLRGAYSITLPENTAYAILKFPL